MRNSKKSFISGAAALTMFAGAGLEATRAVAFQTAQDPEVATCTIFLNKGHAVALPSRDRLATNGNCNPNTPANYTARAINDRTIRVTGDQICDFVLNSDGISLSRMACRPNPARRHAANDLNQ